MGGSAQSKEAGVFVELDSYTYYPGDTLTGKIHLAVDSHAVEIRSVNLKLSGYEKVEWRTVTTRRRRNEREPDKWEEEEEIENHDGRHDFFKVQIPVQEGIAITAGRGQYTYPFQCQLPGFLPGSCRVGTDPKYHGPGRHNQKYHFGECKYKVKAFVEFVGEHTRGGLFSSGVDKVKCSQEFMVVNRCPPAQSLSKTAETAVALCGCSCCSCCSRGLVRVTARMAQDSFRQGESVALVADFDNSLGEKDLTPLDLTLCRTVTLRKGNGHLSFTQKTEICKDSKTGCRAGEMKQETFLLVLPGSAGAMRRPQANPYENNPGSHANSRTTYSGHRQSGTGGAYACPDVVPTCVGGLMKVEYTLEVRGQVTCANDAVTEVPVYIYGTPPLVMRPQVAMAQNWSPQVFNTTIVNNLNPQMGLVSDPFAGIQGPPSQVQMQGPSYGTMSNNNGAISAGGGGCYAETERLIPTGMQPNMVPQQGGMVPQQQQGGMVPQQGGMVPQQGGMVPQQGGMVPQQGGMVPQQQQGGMVPQQGGMVPQQGGMVPQHGGMVPQQQQQPVIQQPQMQPQQMQPQMQPGGAYANMSEGRSVFEVRRGQYRQG